MTPEQVGRAHTLLEKRSSLLNAVKDISGGDKQRMFTVIVAGHTFACSYKNILLGIQTEIDIIENDLLNLGVVCA